MEMYIQTLYEKLISSILSYNLKTNKNLINKAFLFAYDAHKNIYRKSKELYIIHPLNTALRLAQIEADDVSICAWLLHDVLDNKNYNLKDIYNNFWEEICSIVYWVTKLSDIYYTLDMTSKEIENLKKSIVLAWNDIRIFLVKIADRYHNMETLDFLPKEKRYRIARETEEIYLPILNFLSIWEFFTHMHDLCFKYTNEDEYRKLNKLFGKKYKDHKDKIIKIHNEVYKEFEKLGLKVLNIEWRVKSLYSIYKKIKNKVIDINDIYDVLALRIITNSINEVYQVLWIIHGIYKVKSDRFKDYISEPKENWYQSIHTTVYDKDWDYVEFQIQTLEMSKLNKLWIAAHFIYKWFWVDFKNFPDWMKWFINNERNKFDHKLFIEKIKDEVSISEIKCFNEKWSFIFIPKQAVLIDYAFCYWIEYWEYFYWATINGVFINNPFYNLKNWDIIILNKSRNIFTNYKIENYFLLTTKEARVWVKKIFEKYSKTKLAELWKYMLDNMLETYSYKHFHANTNRLKLLVIKSFWVIDEEQLYLFIAIWSIKIENIVQKIIELSFKKNFDKIVYLKLYLKVKNSNIINSILNIFNALSLDLKEVIYREESNIILLKFEIDKKSTLDNLLLELNRAPDVQKIDRIFPLRLKMYYFLYFLSIIAISSIIFFMNFFNFTLDERTFILKIVFFIINILMILIIVFLKYLVKTILPDVLKYKRFWLSLFLLNIYISFLMFMELNYIWYNKDFLMYFISNILYFILLLYEYILYKKVKG